MWSNINLYGSNDEWCPKGQRSSSLCWHYVHTRPSIFQHYYSGKEGKFLNVFHIWSDTESMTLILEGLPWSRAYCHVVEEVKHPDFRVDSLHQNLYLKHYISNIFFFVLVIVITVCSPLFLCKNTVVH